MSAGQLRIIVDVFERGCAVPGELERLGVVVEVVALASGDYRIARDVLVERKTVSDLHGSLASGRLFAQVGRLRDDAPFPYLFVEGRDIDAGPRHPNAVRGALLAIAELGVSVMRSADAADTARWLHRLCVRQARRGRAAAVAVGRVVSPAVSVLAGIPGISLVIASALVERFGSVEGVLAAGPEAWASVDGVGPVRAEALASALLRPGGASMVRQLVGDGGVAASSHSDRLRESQNPGRFTAPPASRASSHHPTGAEAVHALDIVLNEGGVELTNRDGDGEIPSKDTIPHGSHPYPPAG